MYDSIRRAYRNYPSPKGEGIADPLSGTLKKVVQRRFPFSQATYETLRQIMLAEEAPAYSLWAKTSWATKVKPQVGWYVGYVETPKDIWFFALNMEIGNEKDLPLRQDLVRLALQTKGIIE